MFRKQNKTQHSEEQIHEKRKKNQTQKAENIKHALTTAGNSALHYEF